MGLFEDGCDDASGLFEYGPRDVSRQMEEVNKFLAVVNGDVTTDVQKSGNTSFLKVWRDEVYVPWLSFYRDFKSALGPTSRFRDSTFKRAEAFRQLAIRYRENLQKKSTSTVTPTKIPAPVKKPAGMESPPDDHPTMRDSGLNPSWLSWRNAAIAAGVVGGGYFLYRWYTAPKHMAEKLIESRAENERLAQAPREEAA